MAVRGGMPSHVYKGPEHVAIDDQLNCQEAGRYVRRPALREALADSAMAFVDVLRSAFEVPDIVLRDMADHWCHPDIEAPQVWWKDKQPVAPILRQSLIAAIDLAGDLPIDSYWMPMGYREVSEHKVPRDLYRPDAYPFRVVLTKSDWQLTRLIVTPPVPVPTDIAARFTEPSNLWVVKTVSDILPHGETRFYETIGVVNIYDRGVATRPWHRARNITLVGRRSIGSP